MQRCHRYQKTLNDINDLTERRGETWTYTDTDADNNEALVKAIRAGTGHQDGKNRVREVVTLRCQNKTGIMLFFYMHFLFFYAIWDY